MTYHIETPTRQTLVKSDYGLDDLAPVLFEPQDSLVATSLRTMGMAVASGSLVRGEHGTQQIVAVMDLDAPAKQYGRTDEAHTMAEPTFKDNGMAYWVGEYAVIACDVTMLAKVVLVVERGTYFARQGEFPCERGFMVKPHAEGLTATGVSLSKHKAQYDAWRAVMDTVLIDNAQEA